MKGSQMANVEQNTRQIRGEEGKVQQLEGTEENEEEQGI